MLSAVRALLQAFTFHSDEKSLPGNILAKVLETDGERALLQSGDRRFHARLAVQVKEGETLLLKPGETREGVLYCRVLQRMPAQEARGAEPAANLFSALIYPGDDWETPYFLTVRKDTASNAGSADHIQSWQFALRTLNLGLVVLQVRQLNETYSAGLLLESESALKKLNIMMPKLQTLDGDEVAKFSWQKPRLLSQLELRNLTDSGASLNVKT